MFILNKYDIDQEVINASFVALRVLYVEKVNLGRAI